jgi:hypothetical protein
MKDYDSEIAKLQAEIVSLQRSRDILTALPIGQRLAIFMHDELCYRNHTDGCSWLYEIRGGVHDWSATEHVRWKKKALTLLGVEIRRAGASFPQYTTLSEAELKKIILAIRVY